MNIEVKRVTQPDLWREFASMTSGKDCKMSWLQMLKTGHSPIREQRYFITFRDVPQFVTGHIIRHDKFANVGVRSKRVDRGGEDFRNKCKIVTDTLDMQCDNIREGCDDIAVEHIHEMIDIIKEFPLRFDRMSPSSFVFDTNAEEIINISRTRLCYGVVSAETRQIWAKVLELLEEIDPDLVKLCKRPCVWHGFCRESKCCGYMTTDAYKEERDDFVGLFEKRSNK